MAISFFHRQIMVRVDSGEHCSQCNDNRKKINGKISHRNNNWRNKAEKLLLLLFYESKNSPLKLLILHNLTQPQSGFKYASILKWVIFLVYSTTPHVRILKHQKWPISTCGCCQCKRKIPKLSVKLSTLYDVWCMKSVWCMV